MARALNVRDLEKAVKFQEREWAFQRVAQPVIALLLVGALVGLFGNGPLSRAREADPSGTLEVDYERFARHMGLAEFSVTVDSAAIEGGTAMVTISRPFLESMWIQSITPEPDSTTSAPGQLTYEFTAEPGSRPVITFTYRPDAVGLVTGMVTAGEGAAVELSLWIYP